MTMRYRKPKATTPSLKTYHVNLWPLEGCDVQLKASSPASARTIAARVFGGDDITECFAEPDYWSIEEVLAGTA